MPNGSQEPPPVDRSRKPSENTAPRVDLQAALPPEIGFGTLAGGPGVKSAVPLAVPDAVSQVSSLVSPARAAPKPPLGPPGSVGGQRGPVAPVTSVPIVPTSSKPSMGGGGAGAWPSLRVFMPQQVAFSGGQCLATGLRNLGNSCFMNSVLQCLLSISPLRERLLHDVYRSEPQLCARLGSHGEITVALAALFRSLCAGNMRFVVPMELFMCIRKWSSMFADGDQHDSHEFLTWLLDELAEDMRRKPAPASDDTGSSPGEITGMSFTEDSLAKASADAWNAYLRRSSSWLVEMFHGMLLSRLRCESCGFCSISFSPFSGLLVPVHDQPMPMDLNSCIQMFCTDETIDSWCATVCDGVMV